MLLISDTEVGSEMLNKKWATCWLVLISVVAATGRCVAQCSTVAAAEGFPGVTGAVGPWPAVVNASTWWDSDGNGPMPARLVIAGNFTVAGKVLANHVALFNPTTLSWSSLGSGTDGEVTSLATLPDGGLVVAGAFTMAGGVPANRIARWNGGSWSAFGAGFDGTVYALAVMPNGALVAGGAFLHSGGTFVGTIVRWSGSAWLPMVTGPNYAGTDGIVRCLHVQQNGDLVMGGSFSLLGGAWYGNVARFDGVTWTGMPGLPGQVYWLRNLPNGNLVAGGRFIDGCRWWNGSTWSMLGTGFDGDVLGAAIVSNGDLVVTGAFTGRCARWSGTQWSLLGTMSGSLPTFGVCVTPMPDGGFLLGGRFASVANVVAHAVVRYSDGAWTALARGADALVRCQLHHPSGDLIVAGSFTGFGGATAMGLARRVGNTWSSFGTVNNGSVYAMAAMPNGDVVVVGAFDGINGIISPRVARYSGGSWVPMANGPNSFVFSAVALANGDLVVGGGFYNSGGNETRYVARWNGTDWLPLGMGTSGSVHALMELPNGDILAGGSFYTAGSSTNWVYNIARWDGANWSALGSGLGGGPGAAVACLTTGNNGDIIAGGEFSANGAVNVARWDGVTWQPMGQGLNGRVQSLQRLPSGHILAGGLFTASGSTGVARMARWNGTEWTPVIGGLNGVVHSIVVMAAGEVTVGGAFTTADGSVAPYFTGLTTSCPAAVAAVGNGCVGAGGPNILTATSQPWLGSMFQSRATGLAVNSLAASVYGFTQLSIPMPSVHPAGQAGCTLMVNDDILLDFRLANGMVASEIMVPMQSALIGNVFHHQVVPVELDASGTIISLTATNALALTVGAFP